MRWGEGKCWFGDMSTKDWEIWEMKIMDGNFIGNRNLQGNLIRGFDSKDKSDDNLKGMFSISGTIPSPPRQTSTQINQSTFQQQSILTNYIQTLTSYDSGEITQLGFYYEGMWKNNRRFGEGIQRYKNGDCFRGVWVDGFREGAGVLDKKLNEIDGRQSGQKSQNRGSWMFVSPQNSSLENKSKQNEQSPQQNQSQGCQVEGVWKHGKINGDVIIRFKNGDIDFAQFEYGIRNRRGKRIFSNGDVYTGERGGNQEKKKEKLIK
ncbi:MAG: hypothetical protein EZS28_037211 [Streblomastix strix]|uniref:MORN repeat protein n=1 Tax=Streblomastix strix TaxID=222440 RepID=A0A5J4UAS5_9EUKA|nr:MAG: hypothetical protein EZS28_037211 [Streblomastix strix]